ncbi:hypothetical protein [Rubrivivax gelatinosus]
MRLVGDAAGANLPWGFALTLLTAAFIALAAYLGGRLVYEKTVGVHTGP